MVRPLEDVLAGAPLDDLAEVHDSNFIRQMMHNRQIVADEYHRQI